jgi:alpha-D-ribose 1-methylphosphonate 5-triphosphate synthase subunit PhnH
LRSLLEALANPGRVVMLEPEVASAGAAAVPLVLADRGTPVAITGDPKLAAAVVAATGAPIVPVGEARVVALMHPSAELVGRCARGSAEEPELGAKVGMACSRLSEAFPAAEAASCTRLLLEGPGVDGFRRLAVEGLDSSVLEALCLANNHFPAGLDTWLVDDEGHVAGLPRSITVQVL